MLSAADATALAEDLASFTHDPLGYVLWAFPWGVAGTELENEKGPRTWQREVLDECGRLLREGAGIGAVIQEAVSSGHGIGKSSLLAWVIRWSLATHEDTRGVVTANTEGQLRTKTWPEVAKWHRLAMDRELFVCAATSLHSADPTHEKTWRVDAVPWSETNTEAFAGLHNKGKRIIVVFEEASGVADKIWEVTEGALTDENTEILWFVLGNPTNATGRFRECFRRYKHRWHRRQIDARTVEGTNKAQLQKWVDDHGEDSDVVKVRVRGMFPAQSVKQFISEVDIDNAFGKHLVDGQYKWAPVILTLDNAWEGDDEIVIAKRQGLAFSILHTQAKNDNDADVANLLARLEDEHEADAVFIDLGWGTGVASFGKVLGRTWVLVNFADASGDPGCLNKRAEMYKLARNWLKEGGAIPADQVLRDDLLGPQTVSRLDGKLQIESKKDAKARGLPSPNRGDALVLSFAHPVAMKGARKKKISVPQSETYDPLARLDRHNHTRD